MLNDPFEKDMRLSKMSDEALFRLRRDLNQFADVVGRKVSSAKMRLRAIESILSKRGKPVENVIRRSSPPNEASPPPEYVMSDHAIVRYLERVKGFDLTALCEEMSDQIKAGEGYLNGALVESNGFTYVVRPDGFVKSVIPAEWISESDQAFAAADNKRFNETH